MRTSPRYLVCGALRHKVQNLLEAPDSGFVAGVFALFFAQFACFAVERPRLGDLNGQQLDHDIHRPDAIEVVREMGADTE